MFRLSVPFILALCLSACFRGAPTLYEPASDVGGYGFSEVQLDENSYRVSFHGNSLTNQEVVERYAFFHAAQLTLDKGFDYFMVLNKDHQDQTYSGTSSEVKTKNDGWPGRPDLSTTTTEASTTNWSYTESRASLIVRLFKGSEPQSSYDSYNAHEVVKNMDSTIVRPTGRN